MLRVQTSILLQYLRSYTVGEHLQEQESCNGWYLCSHVLLGLQFAGAATTSLKRPSQDSALELNADTDDGFTSTASMVAYDLV